ncbi:hypothetical protein KKD52_15765 [Myxococcota bacterium]|nr:hypothetical protein [Myxococcota bacterium]MBU1410835.1 hypothetical protein [Myxococcota bacterium]MBU1511810.1 hypothetical protein [Myxococcota bacterium]PKN25766.1 MAG: hypothetical protein CVU65_07795 [Deltaproteobacteria bacterium HGW-Deltaproteobacteria-22]
MRSVATFLMALALMGACNRRQSLVNISHSPVQLTPADYSRILKRWTRQYRIIQQFDTTLDIHATLLSWEFRWAYTVAVSRWFRLTETEKKKLWATAQQELESSVEFVVATASTESSWNDLEKGTPDLPGPGQPVKRSLWRVTLEVDSAEPVTPLEIKAIEPISKLHKDMFPYIGYFHRLFVIRFPRTVGGKEVLPETARVIRLRFAGSLGNARLVWQTTNLVVNQ